MHDDRIDHSRQQPDDAMEAELLIGRIIDSEASPADIERFRQLCALEPLTWRRLAQRQQDMLLLAGEFESRIGNQLTSELPAVIASSGTNERHGGALSASPRRRLSLLVSFSGWAAVLILAGVWGLTMHSVQQHREGQRPVTHVPAPMTPDDYLRAYLHTADRVVGEHEPVLMEVVELPDSRIRISSLRRIEEVEYYENWEALPLMKVFTPAAESAERAADEAAR